jgi:hypothetical protein
MNSDHIKDQIRANAAEVVRLHSRIHATFKRRDDNAAAYEEWKVACASFHERYDNLAFPGGYLCPLGRKGALERISSRDPDALEWAICFLEVRPYFLHSGYMFKTMLRRCGLVPLSSDQAARLEAVKAALAEWKRQKNSKVSHN